MKKRKIALRLGYLQEAPAGSGEANCNKNQD
jgi:hypothetical protein